MSHKESCSIVCVCVCVCVCVPTIIVPNTLLIRHYSTPTSRLLVVLSCNYI